jgi:hypothetical protein
VKPAQYRGERGEEWRALRMRGGAEPVYMRGQAMSSETEIQERIALLAPLKKRWGNEIPLAILDRILPPVPCRRTRIRMRRQAEGLKDLRNDTARERKES